MGKEFKRLKRYNATWRLLRTLAVGASLVLLLIGSIMVLSKLHILEGGTVHYAVSAGVALAVAAVYWLLQKRSDMRMAEKIDAEHHLRERVQTMVEYRDQDTAMLQVQREDTEARLKAVRGFGQKKLTLAAHFAALLVAFAVFATGVVLPVQAVPQPPKPTEPPFEASEWQKAALTELIKHVEDSDMVIAAKEPIIVELLELRDALDTKLTSKNVQALVIEAIRVTYAATDAVNSNDDIHDVIQRKVDHDQAEELAYALGAIGNKERENDIATIGEELAKEEMLPTVKGLALMLWDALSASTFDAKDPLYAAVADFAAQLYQVGETESAEDLENAKALLATAINDLKNNAGNALTQQDLNKEECVYVVDELCEIFDIPDNMRPGDPDESYTQGPNQNQSNVGGGEGTGEMQYAGKDQVYDHETDQYEEYGKLLTDRYYALMHSKMKDGSLPEEMVEFIKNYFNELQTGDNVGADEQP